MPRKKKNRVYTYVLLDWLSATAAWAMFFLVRKLITEGSLVQPVPVLYNDPEFFKGITLIPLGWLLIYFLSTTYTDIFKKSRVGEFAKTWLQTAVGSAVLFLGILLDDLISNYRDYYYLLGALFLIHGTMTSTVRMCYLTLAKRHIVRGRVRFNTLVIGGNENASDIYREIRKLPGSMGYHFIGYISLDNQVENGLGRYIPRLGKLDDLSEIIADHEIESVIIAIETSEHPLIRSILSTLQDKRVEIKIIPDMYDILSGSVKMGNVLSAILIEIRQDLMPVWQFVAKRLLDITVSLLVLIICFPLLLLVALRVRFSSPGPVLYAQERIGKHGHPFTMYKFRSMYQGAESAGPRLSSEDDPRITRWGRIMRRYRLDELPQFLNVLKGDMSLVGPRPERKFYIDQILAEAPHYAYLHKVRPGITSWGMVKYGYASNTDQMIERLSYDLLYIENMSLSHDFKILVYTLLILLQGKGK